MKRILLYVFLVFCVGCGIGFYFGFSCSLTCAVLLALVIFTVIMHLKGRKVYCLIYLVVFICGVLNSSYRQFIIKKAVSELEGKTITIWGQMGDDVKKNGNLSSYTLYVDQIKAGDTIYSRKCSLRVVDYKNNPSYAVPYRYVNLDGYIDNSQQYKNTGCFDYNKYLMIEGISGTFIPQYTGKLSTYDSNKRYMMQFIYIIKKQAEDIIGHYLAGKPLGILKGVLTGDTSGIGESDYESFKNCGIVHIFAVSGYNIWLLYYIIFYLLSFIKRREGFKNIFIVIVLSIYAGIAGWTPSVTRAFVMVSLILMGRLLKRDADPLTSLSFAGLIILIINPLMVFDIGFQLSFMSVISVILIFPKLKDIRLHLNNRLKEIAMLTISVQIGILPLTIYYFNSFSVFAVLANIIIVPIVSIFTVGGMLLPIMGIMLPEAAYFLGKFVGFTGMFILNASKLISGLPYSSINITSPAIYEILIYYIIIAIIFGLIKVKSVYQRHIAYALILILLLDTLYTILPGELKISFIDVGQGDSILIKTPDNKYILIDGGGKPENSYSSIDIGEYVLKPYLYKHGVKKIDAVISTHSHEDHLKGLIPVVECFKVDKFIKGGYEGLCEIDRLVDNNSIETVIEGEVIKVGKYITLYVMNPGKKEEDENDASVVIKLIYKNFSALFTGDISAKIEKRLLEYDINCDVLKVPHHGSATSMDMDFLESVSPDAAVISVGRNNFGHPADSTLEKLKDRKIKLYRTDKDGEVIITSRGEGFRIRTAMEYLK